MLEHHAELAGAKGKPISCLDAEADAAFPDLSCWGGQAVFPNFLLLSLTASGKALILIQSHLCKQTPWLKLGCVTCYGSANLSTPLSTSNFIIFQLKCPSGSSTDGELHFTLPCL